jgi:hypothetical protein
MIQAGKRAPLFLAPMVFSVPLFSRRRDMMTQSEIERKALEKAAKYICTMKCGLCPMVVENMPCPQECDLETRPWRCWFAYFQSQSQAKEEAEH